MIGDEIIFTEIGLTGRKKIDNQLKKTFVKSFSQKKLKKDKDEIVA